MKKTPSVFDIYAQNAAYSHTDLACECPTYAKNADGTFFKEYSIDSYNISELTVNKGEGEKASGKPAGRYVTMFCPEIVSPSHLHTENCAKAAGILIRNFICGKGLEITSKTKLLIAGLGNRFITSDAIGPKTADKILATAHLNKSSKSFATLGVPSVSVIMPGVSSQTGIESADIIRGAAVSSDADFIIAIDALAARSTERLCTTIQISDSGIQPGSGIGNHRTPITEKTMGRPVIAIGVPTVISSSTLIIDALKKSEMRSIPDSLADILENGKSFFVSHGESDTICDTVTNILASAVEHAFMENMFS